mmetsp:Transcript_78965/g.132378  ORF Transcript_78965/g.132378 Transcript_78965/m.132378 type:complete len:96 (+) Transcript_78965:174-461(+)
MVPYKSNGALYMPAQDFARTSQTKVAHLCTIGPTISRPHFAFQNSLLFQVLLQPASPSFLSSEEPVQPSPGIHCGVSLESMHDLGGDREYKIILH